MTGHPDYGGPDPSQVNDGSGNYVLEVCCFLLLEPTPKVYRVPRFPQGSPHPNCFPLLPSQATPGQSSSQTISEHRYYRALQGQKCRLRWTKSFIFSSTLCAENRWIQTEVRGPGFEACQGCVVADTGSRRGQERREVVDCELVPFGDEGEKGQRLDLRP